MTHTYDSGTSFTVTVNKERSLRESVEAGRYTTRPTWVWDLFIVNSPDQETVQIILAHLGRGVSTEAALEELDRLGYRPARFEELLAFGAEYPEKQREFPIVALGSTWQDKDGTRYCPCLNGNELGRHLYLDEVERSWEWGDGTRFAAVHK